MAKARPLLTAALLGLPGAVLLLAGAEWMAPRLPRLLRLASDLAGGSGPLVCVVWEGSDGRPAVQACAGWRDSHPWLGIDAWRSGG